MQGFSFYKFLGYHANFFFINKYQLLYCILQYAHAGTWLTLDKNWRFFWRKKKRVSEIYSWSRRFVFRQKFMIKYKSSMFASRDVCIYFSKKNVDSSALLHLYWLYLYKVFTRHLNMECFKSAVTAIFLSYAPTFFDWYFTVM